MYISPAVLEEYQQVLRRPRLKINPDKIASFLADIRSTAELVNPTSTLKISGDESDNRFYECADAAAADYLITGNTQAFSKDHGPTKIITPRDFLDRIVPQLARSDR